ncbi:hypothetical protein BDV96DRAFT_646414 [Lophiotrema nucula]|uniref:ABM domain-containing protein n=1 Tax=Lophiotrema nucula TaxID=690887 RepID=A0A6A5Z7Z8_9PLEO|nr:hypothetical protein BDV96DRAFT_646414 [Lophiotrema nucula]
MASPRLTINVTFYLKPGTEEQFYKAIKPLHEELQGDDKLAYLNLFTSILEPGVVRLIEAWNADKEYLLAALPKRQNFQPFVDAIKDIQVKERTTEAFTLVPGFMYQRED